MRTTNNQTHTSAYHIDPLGLDRLRWLKSFFITHGDKPSNSVIIRRALAVYLEQIEKAMVSDEKIRMELIRLKAHTNPDRSPWPVTPGFNGQPFSKMLHAERKYQSQRTIGRMFKVTFKTNNQNPLDGGCI